MKQFAIASLLLILAGCTLPSVSSETCNGMTIETALTLIEASNCSDQGTLTTTYNCNEVTSTWWVDLIVPEADGCAPACVVNTQTQEVEINWRCTGLLPPESEGGEINLSTSDLDTMIQDLEGMGFDDLGGLAE